MRDKLTIGVTASYKTLIDHLKDRHGYFDQDTHVAKFALALAVKRGLQPGTAEGAVTAWAVSNFDSDGSLRSFVGTAYGTDTPYRLIEQLIDAGFAAIASHMDHSGNLDFERLLGEM